MKLRTIARPGMILFPLAFLACVQGDGATELGNFGVGDTLLEQPVSIPPAVGGPEAGTFEGVSFTLEQSAATLVLVNEGLLVDIRNAGLSAPRANNIIADRPIESNGFRSRRCRRWLSPPESRHCAR